MDAEAGVFTPISKKKTCIIPKLMLLSCKTGKEKVDVLES
jgi:hypothetical protein